MRSPTFSICLHTSCQPVMMKGKNGGRFTPVYFCQELEQVVSVAVEVVDDHRLYRHDTLDAHQLSIFNAVFADIGATTEPRGAEASFLYLQFAIEDQMGTASPDTRH